MVQPSLNRRSSPEPIAINQIDPHSDRALHSWYSLNSPTEQVLSGSISAALLTSWRIYRTMRRVRDDSKTPVRGFGRSRTVLLTWLSGLAVCLISSRSAAFVLNSDPSQNIISTIAGSATGTAGGDGGPAVFAGLYYPQDIAVDSIGNIFIADGSHIRKVGADGIITNVAGTSDAGFSGDGGPATSAQLGFVWGITVDASGNVFI